MKDRLEIAFESIVPDPNFDNRHRFENINAPSSQLAQGDSSPDRLPVGDVDIMVCWRCMDETGEGGEIWQDLQDSDFQLCREVLKVEFGGCHVVLGFSRLSTDS